MSDLFIKTVEKIIHYRKIVWEQDPHGQWSSGDLEVRPAMQGDRMAWTLWLGDKQIGRPHGYWSPRDARGAAPMCREVRTLTKSGSD